MDIHRTNDCLRKDVSLQGMQYAMNAKEHRIKVKENAKPAASGRNPGANQLKELIIFIDAYRQDDYLEPTEGE